MNPVLLVGSQQEWRQQLKELEGFRRKEPDKDVTRQHQTWQSPVISILRSGNWCQDALCCVITQVQSFITTHSHAAFIFVIFKDRKRQVIPSPDYLVLEAKWETIPCLQLSKTNTTNRMETLFVTDVNWNWKDSSCCRHLKPTFNLITILLCTSHIKCSSEAS